MNIIPEIKLSISHLVKSDEQISNDRKRLLNQFAEFILSKLKDGKEVNLTFICTHNSRRSHISQIWAQTVAEYYGISNINCYSGGTEATAFNPRAVNSMRNAGFKIEKKNDSDNPVYLVYYSDDKDPIECFSKVYSDEYNPQKDFAAIMTCSDANENCPVVFGAEARFPIRYEDPKKFDNTDLEESKYNERVEQIGREMFYSFANVKKSII